MTDPWFAWELGRAAREAHASRTRVLTGMGLLVVAAVAVIVAGVFVDESVFWAAVAPVFAAALTVLVAYGAVRLGVFAQTAELLGRRAERSAGSSPVALPDRARLEWEMQGQGAYDVGVQLMPNPRASEPPRANLVAALQAFELASHHGHGEATRQRALLELRLGGDNAQRHAYISLLHACQNGSPVAAYNLGALHGHGADQPVVDRDVLLAYAHEGVAAAAFVVGLLDASLDAVNAQQMPGQTRSIGFLWGRPMDLI